MDDTDHGLSTDVKAAKKRLLQARATVQALNEGVSRPQTSFRKQLLECCRMARKIDRDLDFAAAFLELCHEYDLDRAQRGRARFLRLIEFLGMASSDAARTRHAVLAEQSTAWSWKKFKRRLMQEGPSKLLAEAKAVAKLAWRFRAGERPRRASRPYDPLQNLQFTRQK